jgi:hypothetical protein
MATMAKITAKDVLQVKWALDQGLVKPEQVGSYVLVVPELDQDTDERHGDDSNDLQDTILPEHLSFPSNNTTDTPEDNPVTRYVNEMIVDLVSKKHVQFMNMGAVRSVFRSVLLKLCDAEPHTFAEIRSTITPSRRNFVKQIIVCLQRANLVVEVELNNRLFYRADLEEIHKIRAYIIYTEAVK